MVRDEIVKDLGGKKDEDIKFIKEFRPERYLMWVWESYALINLKFIINFYFSTETWIILLLQRKLNLQRIKVQETMP